MPLTCLTGARFTQRAVRLTDFGGQTHNPDEYGQWVESQDPLTGEVVRVWVPSDDPNTPNVNESTIPCQVRGIVDGGIRVAGTTERFGDTYMNIDYAKMWVPTNIRLTKNDRITNITDKRGRIQWRDEEFETDPTQLKATVFNVNGVTPLFNAFNDLAEWFVLLERAEI